MSLFFLVPIGCFLTLTKNIIFFDNYTKYGGGDESKSFRYTLYLMNTVQERDKA